MPAILAIIVLWFADGTFSKIGSKLVLNMYWRPSKVMRLMVCYYYDEPKFSLSRILVKAVSGL